MLEPIVNKLKLFREQIYQFFSSRRDAAFELVDSLSGNITAKSIAELSLNPLHRRNYCSITRALDEFYPATMDKNVKNNALTKILSEQGAALQNRHYYLFGVDSTPNPRKYSPTQEDRGFVYEPNIISGNKPVTIGHQYSVVALLPEKEDKSPPWVFPLSCHRVTTDENSAVTGMRQISQCIRSQDEFKNNLCVSVADSAYSNADPIFESIQNPNQVHISRLRSNRVLYYPIKQTDNTKRGRKKRFGEPFRLNNKETQGEPDEKTAFETTNKKGKKQIVHIECWNNIVMRGTHRSNISTQVMRLVKICVHKESGEPIFKKPLWLIVTGERRFELSLLDIFNGYRQRFDIEHFFRFGKNRLLLNKSQTPDVIHEEAWWQLCMISYAQLYLARDLAFNIPTPWGKYLPTNNSSILSPTQVQKDFNRIIGAIGTPAKPPKPSKKAPGRKKGDTQSKRARHAVVIKKKIKQPVAVSP